MKLYKTDAKKREKARKYYYEHREKLLNYSKSRYKRKGTGKCKSCGKDLSDMPNWHFTYCNKCIKDETKVSRQARWYRRHSERIREERRKNSKKK